MYKRGLGPKNMKWHNCPELKRNISICKKFAIANFDYPVDFRICNQDFAFAKVDCLVWLRICEVFFAFVNTAWLAYFANAMDYPQLSCLLSSQVPQICHNCYTLAHFPDFLLFNVFLTRFHLVSSWSLLNHREPIR